MRRGDDLVARVVAWHNRNPLARRIDAGHVVSVGLVSFPFRLPPGDPVARATGAPAPPPAGAESSTARNAQGPDAAEPATVVLEGGGGLRERAEAAPREPARPAPAAPAARGAPAAAAGAAARRGDNPARSSSRRGWRPAFDEDLLDPYPPATLARFALRHGVPRRPGPAEAPEREVAVARGTPGGAAIVRLWVHAVAIDLGARRVRVLVAPGGRAAVLGPRLVGRGRAGAAGAFFAAALAAAAALSWPGLGLSVRPNGPAATTLSAAVPPAASATAGGVALPSKPVISAPASPSLVAAAAAHATAPAPNQPEAPPAPLPRGAPTAPHPEGSPTAPRSAQAPTAPTAAKPAPAATSAAAAMPGKTATTPGVAGAPPEPASARGASAGLPRAPAAPAPLRAGPARLVPDLDESTRQAARALGELARADRARQLAERNRAAGAAAVATGEGPRVQAARSAATEAPPRSDAAPPVPPQATAAADGPSQPSRAGGGTAVAGAGVAAAPPAAWAISTRRLRTRFESEQMLSALRDIAYRAGHGSELKLEVLPSGDDWRAVGWPLASRAEAERLRDALAARGLKIEVVQF